MTKSHMICGTFLRTIIDPYKSANGEMYGWMVAENELIRATLDRSDMISWDFWIQGLSPSLADTVVEATMAYDLTSLKTQHGDRVKARPMRSLRAAAANSPYIFVTNVPGFSQFSEIRDGQGCAGIPICSLVHSVSTNDIMATYSWLAMNAWEFDVLVASSKAGRVALENIFASVSERFSRKFRNSPSLPALPRIVDIPFGVAVPDESLLDRDVARRVLNLPSGAFVILYLGRVSEEFKADLDPLLQAVESLSLESQNVWLMIAGQALDTTYNEHLRRRLSRLNLDKRTIHLDNFPSILKSTIYAACDVFVSPADSIQETFGLALLEAMAHARPVIASSWSGYRDLVVDNTTGFLIKTRIVRKVLCTASAAGSLSGPREVAHSVAQGTLIDIEQLVDSLKCLLRNPERAAEMGRAGRKRILDQYAWPKIVDRLESLWEEQLALAKTAVHPPLQKAGLQHYFAHYADQFLEPDDLIVNTLSSKDAKDLLGQWKFRNPATVQRLETKLALFEGRAISVREIYHNPNGTELVNWLLKKGFLRVESLRAQTDKP